MHSDDIVYEGDLLTAAHRAGQPGRAGRGDRPGQDGGRGLAVARLLQRVPRRPGLHVRAVAGDPGPARPGRRGRGRGREPLDHPPVLPGGVRPAAGPGRPGAADQRGRAQPERLQGRLQRRRPLGHRVGLRRRRGQHACRPTSTAAAAPSSGCPRTRTARCRPATRGPASREALDPDDYSGGCAVWSGTSFSAPLLAAHFVRALLAGPADPASGLVLEPCDAQTTTNRALAALTSMGWPG